MSKRAESQVFPPASSSLDDYCFKVGEEGDCAPLSDTKIPADIHRDNFEGSQRTDDIGTDLEQCFWEEMKGIDSSEEFSAGASGGSDGENEAQRKKLKDRLDIPFSSENHSGNTFSIPGWSQFMNSAEGVRQYMEDTIMKIMEASDLASKSSPQCKVQGDGIVEISEARQLSRASPHGTDHISISNEEQLELNIEASAAPPDSHRNDIIKESTTVADLPDISSLSTEQERATIDNTTGTLSALNHQSCPRSSSGAGESTINIDTFFAEHRNREGDGDTERHRFFVSNNETLDKEPRGLSFSRAFSPSGNPTSQGSLSIFHELRCLLATPDRSCVGPAQAATCDSPAQNVHKGNGLELFPPQSSPLSRLETKNGNETKETRTEPEKLSAAWYFEADQYSARQKKLDIEQQLDRVCGEIGDESSIGAGITLNSDIIAYVGEVQVTRRVERNKDRTLQARRQRREDGLKGALCTRSAVALQSVWRGRCTRARVAPARITRRWELEERKRMFHEQQLMISIVALEVEREKIEWKNLVEELSSMRIEEQRARQAWEYHARRQEVVRQEELARMRAEERCTRALLYLEIEESNRMDIARREAREAASMVSEDLAMRELKRLHKKQMSDRRAMEAEDRLSKMRAHEERRKLAAARAEGCRMAVEDFTSMAWNSKCRRERELFRRWSRARSTPIQRAMNPQGVAAAKIMTNAPPKWSDQCRIKVVQTSIGAESDTLTELDDSGVLILEQARRRESYTEYLDSISARSLEAQMTLKTITSVKDMHKWLEYGGNCNAHDENQRTKSRMVDQGPPQVDRSGPPERDGAECNLSVDMLSHLGPLQDLMGLELCVEGLTSASLLRECTSLKSLSLNVNRLTSPAGLGISTALLRLGLRDNRLSSLQGLSGLPNLRELRLDINHLTSLHELRFLPALVELSANTNHIEELPERFATGLMASAVLPPDRIKSPPTLIDSAMACGGLQKLELYHNRITSVHSRALEGFFSLTHLDLGRNQLKTLDGHGLEWCPALSTLVLSQNLLRQPPFPLRLPLLSELWLSGNKIESMGTWASTPPKEMVGSSFQSRFKKCIALKREVSERERETSLGIYGCNEIMRQNEPPTAKEHNIGKDNGFVWLPSLEVLHLQDNSLENLGGRWSLAGCPLLRCLDASFNHIRTPGDFTTSLQVCHELDEVRLHDNPASENRNYADVVALSCPHIARIDGVGLDLQAHWQAGVHIYGGRADLVVPFLQQTTGRSSARVNLEVAGVYSPGERTKGNDSKPNTSKGKNGEQECPWCGALGTSNADKTERGTSSMETGGSVSEGDGSLEDPASVVGTYFLAGGKSQTNWPSIAYDGSPQQRRCESCGFAFPDMDLWSVPVSNEAHAVVKWDAVLSAGHQWREKLCADASAKDMVKIDIEEVVGKAFHKSCLRGRDERMNMRRRHKREERDLVSNPAAMRADTKITDGAGADGVLSASIAISTQKLEIELEKKKAQAKEQRTVAARQLSVHGGGCVLPSDITRRNETCVVLNLKSGNTYGTEVKCKHLDDRAPKGHNIQESSAHQRSTAARAIGRFWRKVTQAAQATEPLQQDGQEVGALDLANEQAVTKLQSAFRGFHVRRALQAALDSARYIDDELEGLLRADGGGCFQIDMFLSPPPELADSWWRNGATTSPQPKNATSTLQAGFSRARATSARLTNTARAVISNTGQSTNTRVEQIHNLQVNAETLSIVGPDLTGGGKYERNTAHSSSVYDTGEGQKSAFSGRGVNSVDPEPFSQGTFSVSMSNDDDVAREGKERGATDSVNVVRTDASGEKVDSGSGGNVDGSPGRRARNGLVEAWGLKDPNVAEAMMKRTKRMRKFLDCEARREKMKDPEVRFNNFAKNAGRFRTADQSDIGPSRRDCGQGSNKKCSRASGGRPGLASPMPVSLVARIRLAPMIDTWARSETAHQKKLHSPHTCLHGGKGAVRDTRRTILIPAEKNNAVNPLCISSLCVTRPWPPPKPPPRGGSEAMVDLLGPSSYSEARRGHPRAPRYAHISGQALPGGGAGVDASEGNHSGLL